MKIIKRSGKEDVFDRAKIIAAVGKANITVIEAEQLSSETKLPVTLKHDVPA